MNKWGIFVLLAATTPCAEGMSRLRIGSRTLSERDTIILGSVLLATSSAALYCGYQWHRAQKLHEAQEKLLTTHEYIKKIAASYKQLNPTALTDIQDLQSLKSFQEIFILNLSFLDFFQAALNKQNQVWQGYSMYDHALAQTIIVDAQKANPLLKRMTQETAQLIADIELRNVYETYRKEFDPLLRVHKIPKLLEQYITEHYPPERHSSRELCHKALTDALQLLSQKELLLPHDSDSRLYSEQYRQQLAAVCDTIIIQQPSLQE